MKAFYYPLFRFADGPLIGNVDLHRHFDALRFHREVFSSCSNPVAIAARKPSIAESFLPTGDSRSARASARSRQAAGTRMVTWTVDSRSPSEERDFTEDFFGMVMVYQLNVRNATCA